MIPLNPAMECVSVMKRTLTLSLLLALLAGCQSGPAREASADETPRLDASSAAAEGEATRAEAEPAPPADFRGWLARFRQEARREGISEPTLARALDGVRYRPRVIELDRSQPEFVRPIWQYLDSAVSAQRDRKSTRLNSSHVRISYAVFCL